jgi:hypothetical protein
VDWALTAATVVGVALLLTAPLVYASRPARITKR